MAVLHAHHEALRHRGHRGGPIAQHRALAIIELRRTELYSAFGLALGLLLAWRLAVPRVCRLWGFVFRGWLGALDLNAHLASADLDFGPLLRISIPYPSLEAGEPTFSMLWLTALAIVALSAVAFFLPKRMVPLSYLLWATAFIQATAVFYFALFPNRFPHDLPSYISTMMTSGLVLISFVPVLLAFTYYFLEQSMARKLVLTCLTMTYLTLF